MRKALVFVCFCLVMPAAAGAEMQVSDNLTYGFGGYIGNSTDIAVSLPEDFNLQGNFTVSSSGGERSLSFSAGGGRELFYQMMSLNALYNGNRSGIYASDGGELIFSARPFMMLTTFVDVQLEMDYFYTRHAVSASAIDSSAGSHSLKIGMGLGILQTASAAVSYTCYFYPDINGNTLNNLSKYVYWHPALAGAASIIAGLPSSAVDMSFSDLFFESLNAYVSYSIIKDITSSFSHSVTAGADYQVNETLTLGSSYSVSFFQGAASHFISVSTALNF